MRKNFILTHILHLIAVIVCIGCLPASGYAQNIENTSDLARERLLSICSGEWVSRGLYVAAKLEIAEHLQTGPKSIDALAKLVEANPSALHRLLHMLAGYGVFQEVSEGTFANTPTSHLLSKEHPDSLHSLAIFYGEDIHKALSELLPSIQTGRPAFELTFAQPVFSYFKANPNRAALFQEAMKEKSRAVIQSALSAFDFHSFETIYDIGGGYGQFMQGLLEKHPNCSGTLFELPEVVKKIQERETPLSYSLCSGDFFDSIPQGGDLYILKSVLHDWDDIRALKILKNCQKAMHQNSRLLIVEVVLLPKDQSIYANCMDLLMLAITGGKERSLDSFKQMFNECGLTLEKIHPTTTEFSMLEVKKYPTN